MPYVSIQVSVGGGFTFVLLNPDVVTLCGKRKFGGSGARTSLHCAMEPCSGAVVAWSSPASHAPPEQLISPLPPHETHTPATLSSAIGNGQPTSVGRPTMNELVTRRKPASHALPVSQAGCWCPPQARSHGKQGPTMGTQQAPATSQNSRVRAAAGSARTKTTKPSAIEPAKRASGARAFTSPGSAPRGSSAIRRAA